MLQFHQGGLKFKQKIGRNRCYCRFQLGSLNDHLFRKELFILFTVRVFRERISTWVCASFPFGFNGGMWNLIVLVPDYCLSFYFVYII